MDSSNIPALAPPPGSVSNFNDPRTLSTSLIALLVVFMSLMLAVVGMRLYSRALLSHAVGWDDYMCLLAASLAAAHSAIVLWIIRFGYGRHLWDIRAVTLTPSHLRLMGSLSIIGSASTFSIKTSILLFYLQLFRVNPRFKYWVYFGILFCAIYTAAYWGVSAASLIECSSPQSIEITLCAHSDISTLVAGAVNVVTDFYVLLLPIRIVTRLNTRRGKKIRLMAVFLCGLVASSANLARLIVVILQIHSPDVFWSAAMTTLLGTVEMNLGIIAASMPALPQFFNQIRIFHASSYSPLRRLINKHGPPSNPWFGRPSQAIICEKSRTQREPLSQHETETDLQILSIVRAYTSTNMVPDDASL
ncbi:hypothetical protein BDR22DRAFT_841878 [Usnea florida]